MVIEGATCAGAGAKKSARSFMEEPKSSTVVYGLVIFLMRILR